jgi:hypothetical protein
MFDWFRLSSVLPHVLIVLFAAAVTSAVGWYITGGKLDVERLGRENDRISYVAEQERYKANALNEKMIKEAEYARIKEEQDVAYNNLLTQYRTAIVRYKASFSPGSRANLPSSTPATPVDAGAGSNTLVPVPIEDLEICAVNTAKAQVAHEWAKEIAKQ